MAKNTVEPFIVTVFPRTARVDLDWFDANLYEPFLKVFSYELPAIVRSNAFRLSKMKSALDASEAAGSVLTAFSTGELTPIEATRVMGLIDSYRRTLELTDIEERLRALEEN